MDNRAGIDPETVDDALDVLRQIVLWELTPPRWEQVTLILQQLGDALAAGDVERVRDLVADLELSGPTRILRIGATETSGIPEPALERRNTLVHTLSRPGSPPEPVVSTEDDRGRPAR